MERAKVNKKPNSKALLQNTATPNCKTIEETIILASTLSNPISQHCIGRDANEILPESFVPSSWDIICGRQRENFHHEGNKYFRDLIQKNMGPYIASRSKLEKGDAIARITKIARGKSPFGGFVRKDERSGRWFRIKDSEAKDKVGHAIRKAVQRLEDTKPKLAARLRNEYSTEVAKAAEELIEKDDKDGKGRDKKPKAKSDANTSSGKNAKKEVALPSEIAQNAEAQLQLTAVSDAYANALASRQSMVLRDTAVSLTPGLTFPLGSSPSLRASATSAGPPSITSFEHPSTWCAQGGGLPLGPSSDPTGLLSTGSSNFPSSYNYLLALCLHGQRSQDELALIRALQRQEESIIRREIECSSQRLLPLINTSRDAVVNMMPLRAAVTTNPLVLGLSHCFPPQLTPLVQPINPSYSDASAIIAQIMNKRKEN